MQNKPITETRLLGMDMPTDIIYGVGSAMRLSSLNRTHKNVLIVTSQFLASNNTVCQIMSEFNDGQLLQCGNVPPNPEIFFLEHEIRRLSTKNIELILAIGGGSVIDSAKAIAALVKRYPHITLRSLLETGQTLPEGTPSIPLIAVPTTAGTGSEVTHFATIWDKSKFAKHSLVSETLRPFQVVLDPELTLTMGRDLTLFTALDAISHSVEALWNKNASPRSIAYAVKSLELSTSSLTTVLNNPTHIEARGKMQMASTFAGAAISLTKTAIAHSISYPLTAHFNVPHGLACSFTLPSIYDRFFMQDQHTHLLPDIVGESMDMIRRLDLSTSIQKFASRMEIVSTIPEMFYPGRADNFFANVNQEVIEEIVNSSLNRTTC